MLCTSLLTDAVGALALLPMPGPSGAEGVPDSPTFCESLIAAHSDAEELPLTEERDAREQTLTMTVSVPVFFWRPPLEIVPTTRLEPAKVRGFVAAPTSESRQMPTPVPEVAISGTIGVEAAASPETVDQPNAPRALADPDPTINATTIPMHRARPAEAVVRHVEVPALSDVVPQPGALNAAHAPALAEPPEARPVLPLNQPRPAAEPKVPHLGPAEPAADRGQMLQTPQPRPALPRDDAAREPQPAAPPPQADRSAMTERRPSASEGQTVGMRAVDHVPAVQRPATPSSPPSSVEQTAPDAAIPAMPALPRAETPDAAPSERPRVHLPVGAPSAPPPAERSDDTQAPRPLIKMAAPEPKVDLEQDRPTSKTAPERDVPIERPATPDAPASTLYASTTVRAAPQSETRHQADAPRPAAPPPPAQLPENVQAPRPMEKISFSVGGSDGQPRAEILLQHKPDGAIQMAVRTPDARFAQTLRSGVSELNATLDSRGYRSELQATPPRESAGDQQDQPHRRPRWFYERNDDDN